MYLMFYVNENDDKVYILQKDSPEGSPTESAHPARFSPDDKFSKRRVVLKKRFGLLHTQSPPPTYTFDGYPRLFQLTLYCSMPSITCAWEQ
ncbi:hypothetical protein L7F22_016840 [Adiantum nelumboides]|nr:hypothetical protein [Adiantum nelumboides]